MKTSEIVKSSKITKFLFYREGNFMYETDNGFRFPIPLEDIGKATLNNEEKTIFFMRWIRKYNEELNNNTCN